MVHVLPSAAAFSQQVCFCSAARAIPARMIVAYAVAANVLMNFMIVTFLNWTAGNFTANSRDVQHDFGPKIGLCRASTEAAAEISRRALFSNIISADSRRRLRILALCQKITKFNS